MTKKGEAVTLSLSPEQKEQLEQVALQLGQTWGKEPNISKLMRAIADGELKVILASRKHQTTKEKRNIKAAIALLQEALES